VPGRPRIQSIELDLGLVSEGADPDHPDSLDHYRLLVTPNPTMTVHASGDLEMILVRTLLVFYMVRGDAAVLPGGAPALADRWYVRRMVETPEPRMTDAAGSTHASAGLRLAKNPASGPFEVDLSIPETGRYQIEVFDVTGRRAVKRSAETIQAGASRVELRDTGKLPAGIYWISLSREGRTLATRVATRL
jgi:hypothetical protein